MDGQRRVVEAYKRWLKAVDDFSRAENYLRVAVENLSEEHRHKYDVLTEALRRDRSMLNDSIARLQATTALLERCRREWLKAARSVLTEVGRTLDEQRSLLFDLAERGIRSAVELIRTAADLPDRQGCGAVER
jgi:hypothetical protein